MHGHRNAERVACTKCGALILPVTAQETGALCMPCNGGYRRQIDEGRLRLEEAKKRRDRRNAVPIMLSFDLVGADAVHYKTLQSQFERFGWENVGGSCYR